MTMRQFIQENKEVIDGVIKSVCKNCAINNKDREDWILNDESLYHWARQEGVRI